MQTCQPWRYVGIVTLIRDRMFLKRLVGQQIKTRLSACVFMPNMDVGKPVHIIYLYKLMDHWLKGVEYSEKKPGHPTHICLDDVPTPLCIFSVYHHYIPQIVGEQLTVPTCMFFLSCPTIKLYHYIPQVVGVITSSPGPQILNGSSNSVIL